MSKKVLIANHVNLNDWKPVVSRTIKRVVKACRDEHCFDATDVVYVTYGLSIGNVETFEACPDRPKGTHFLIVHPDNCVERVVRHTGRVV